MVLRNALCGSYVYVQCVSGDMQAERRPAVAGTGSIQIFIEKAKAGGLLSSAIRSHVFGDIVDVSIDGVVRVPDWPEAQLV